MAPQSPTTGSFHFSTINQENTMKTTQIARDHFEFPVESPKATALKKCSLDIAGETNVQQNMSCIGLTNIHESGNCARRANQFEQRSAVTSYKITCNGSDDGYTWRKYGQKHVKGSEFPRSYYKCTQQNCPVKKKVERSPDGQITEIVYKGAHNHHKSQPPRRATMSSTVYGLGETSEMSEGNIGGSNSWRSVQFERNKDVRAPSGLDRTSSASVLTKVSDPLMLNYQKTNINAFESAGTTPEPSSTLASRDDEDEDRATEGSTSLGDDVDDYAFDHKRRRREFYSVETSLSSRTTREPRVVVQIESEIDILDDGYRWRKYGQKVVKGNPNPRSYYKCTSAGCPVRKHVERAPDNLISVITTYEGKHNHEVPSTNKTNCAISGNQALTSTSKTHKVSNLGMQVQDCNFQFNRKPFDYVRPSFLDLRFGATSPIYDLKFPTNLHSYGSFLLSPTQVSNSCSFAPLQMPEFPLPLSLPMSLPLVGPNIVPPLGGFHFNDLPLTPNGVSSHSSIAVGDQKYIHDDNNNNKNAIIVRGNEEIKNENLCDHQNGASSAVFCGQIMDNFPS
ncbi:WRKY transcription factor SUSIBA2-like isoform X3 [Nicotiana tabacum]|uniref:Probable WRKY transcription factor 33 isoform X3 n=1 Tax=Nicotiana tabacum TaxID=4097 RepID=A0A1S4BBZ1_TOBAC|nr:PREDICTED: probable WRKY transcription factor 33 isoform X3 [Nicotiana tabacum]